MENTQGSKQIGFQREDWQLFRNIASLGQKAGVPRSKLAALALKELADNALDAGAHCFVKCVDGVYYVADDGPGIAGSDEEIAHLFSIRRALTSSKLFRLPTRGALGNGLRVVAGVVLCCGGQLFVATRGRALQLQPQDDGSTKVLLSRPTTDSMTVIGIKFAGELAEARRPMEMAELAITARGESRHEGKSNPHWYDSDSFFELLQGAGARTLGDVLDNLAGGDQRGLLAGGLLARRQAAGSISRAEAEALLGDLRARAKEPKPSVLGEVGAMAFSHHGYAKKFGTVRLAPGLGTQSANLPCVVEVWAERASSGVASAQVMVNRTPVTADVQSYSGQARHRAETTIYGCGLTHRFKTGKAPMRLTICVTTPYMSITTDGKEPNLLPLFAPISEAIAAACRKARAATSSGRPASKKSVILDALPEAIEKASGPRGLRFSLRQLFYAVRPALIDACGEEPDYGYFSSMIADYEKANGAIRLMYRDARGIVFHPHTRETIPLGTLNVERYQRPEYRFNKVLYVEKGGFFELLKDAQWPERHDCALMTSQGFASGAARDLLDLIGQDGEPVQLFCVHDADGYGTCIYEALVSETRSRTGRRVDVINLGLDPAEAVEMGLAEEKVDGSKKKVPVADYIRNGRRGWHWEEWLQSKRIELNSMTSPQFLEWLDRKIAEHVEGSGKLVPPVHVLREKLVAETREQVRARLIEQAVRAFNVDGKLCEAMDGINLPPSYAVDDGVRDYLSAHGAAAWEQPIAEMAKQAARNAVE